MICSRNIKIPFCESLVTCAGVVLYAPSCPGNGGTYRLKQRVNPRHAMPKLHHFPLDPYGRRLRLSLAEYGVEVRLAEERPWVPSAQLTQLNPSGLSPVYVEDSGIAICGPEAITEYLEETLGARKSLLPGTAVARAEIRRLVGWFDVKFYTEVTEPVLTEKVIRRFVAAANGASSPQMARVRQGLQVLKAHLDYIGALSEERSWLGGEELSLADLAAAAHISAIDYLGDVPWKEHPVAQSWYQRIKSRPSFRVLLQDTVPGMAPSQHYADLDF
jgi:glutathione S-transferase